MRTIPLGNDDFREIRLKNHFYVDKSLFIREILDASKVLLLPRPRRFGKTLNMTMLQTFFETQQDSRALFDGLAICADLEAMAHINAYPTIFLNLKSVDSSDWVSAEALMKELITSLYRKHRPTLETLVLDEEEQAYIKTVYDRSAPLNPLTNALKRLTEWLHRATGKRVILLIDEYDTPIHVGSEKGYYAEVISFLRGFLGGALKSNPALERAVITGIFRVGNEFIYPGLNNLSVHSVLSPKFSRFFGFTETEVIRILVETGSPHPLSEVQAWYNGYRFGNETIYNPWSILKMLELGHETLQAYWIGTSGNQLIEELIKSRTAIKPHQLETLLRGQSLKCDVEDRVAMGDITPQSVWTLLLYSGYLTAESYDGKTNTAQLRLPNFEVRSFFEAKVKLWLGEPELVFKLIDHLLALRLEPFAEHLAQSIKTIFSYHDVSGKEPEKSYHFFMAGLLACLSDRYEVLSNRESGFGRYDLAMAPRLPELPGLIFEFKKAEPHNLDQMAAEALVQISSRDYANDMRQRGVPRIVSIGLAFSGKRVALASSIQDATNPHPSEVVHYQAGEPEFELGIGHEPNVSSGVEADLTQKAFLAGQIQLLQKVKGQKQLPKETLIALDLRILESMLEALQS